MISRKRLRLILGVLLAFCSQCSWQTVANKDEKRLEVVRFPEPFTKTVDGSTVALADTNGFVVRKKAGPQPELIFAMKGLVSTQQGAVESVFSDEFFAVSFDNHFSVRAATADEWERAEQLPNTRRNLRSNKFGPASEPATHTEDGVRYQGKLFQKSGDFWGNTVGLLSPNGRFLAVFSFSSSAKPRTSWSTLDGGMPDEPRPGEMFVDVYDASHGKPIQSGRAHYESSPSMLFYGALWVGDSYLVVPLDPVKSSDIAGQACLLSILPTL